MKKKRTKKVSISSETLRKIPSRDGTEMGKMLANKHGKVIFQKETSNVTLRIEFSKGKKPLLTVRAKS